MGFPTMRVQYPYDSSSPRAFLKAHHVLAAFVAAALVTAAVGVSAGAWQLSKGSDESASATRNTSGFDRIEYMAGGGSPSIRIATVDELIAMNEAALEPHFGAAPAAPEVVVPSASTDELLAIHEALTDAQFGAEQTSPSNDGPIYPLSREGVRGPVTVD